MLKVILIIFLSFNLFAAPKLKRFTQIKKEVSKYKKSTLMKELRLFLAASRPNRFFGTKGHAKARAYLKSRLQTLATEATSGTFKELAFDLDITKGKELYQKDFDTKIKGTYAKTSSEFLKWNQFTKYMQSLIESKKTIKGMNYLFHFKGKKEDEIVITAHYDTVSHDKKSMQVDQNSLMPGADYNGSGVAIALGMIDFLKGLDLEYSVKFVFLDAASLGFLGAYDYVNQHVSDKTIGAVNLEMLGHDSSYFDKNKKTKNFKVYLRKNNDDDYVLLNLFAKNRKKAKNRTLFKESKTGLDSSDHYRFWEKGIPALMYSQNWEDDFNSKRYQTKNDIAETINQETFYAAYEYLASMLASFALNISK